MLDIFILVTAVLSSITIHEFAHGYIAYKLGDPTAKMSGRLTLNPLSHIDIFGCLMLVFVGFGWAKPVPVNSRRLKNPKRDMMLVSLAGPVSNFLFALLLLIVIKLFQLVTFTIIAPIYELLWTTISISVGLGVFNLVPIPPLDGSKIILPFLPRKVQYYIYNNQQFIQFGLMILLYFGFLSLPLYMARLWVINSLTSIVNLVFFFI